MNEEIERAMEKMEKGDVHKALTILKRFVRTADDEEKFAVADLYIGWGFIEKAINILEKLLKKYPNEGQIMTKLAELYIETKRDDAAIDLLNQIDENDPYYVSSLLQLADLYDAQGLFEVAEQKLLLAKEKAPDEKVIDFALGEFMFSTGQYGRAIPFYEQVISTYGEFNRVVIRERLAECYANIGNYEGAYEYYKEIDTENPDTLFKYGYTAKQQNDNARAISIWKELLELDPYYHSVYPLLAETLKEEGRFEEAKEIINLGLGYNEFAKELYLLDAKLHLAENNKDKAEKQLQKAIEQDPDYQEAVMMLIDLYKKVRDDSKIIELIEEIKASGSHDPLYDWELAKAYVNEESYDKAFELYKTASESLMDNPDFLKEYGYFLAEEGQLDEALAILEKYLELVPLDDEIIDFVERLKFSSDD